MIYIFIILLHFCLYSFSEEEDQLIMKVEKCDVIKTKLSVLSLILNRSRMQLYRRNGVLKNQFEKCKSKLIHINIRKHTSMKFKFITFFFLFIRSLLG